MQLRFALLITAAIGIVGPVAQASSDRPRAPVLTAAYFDGPAAYLLSARSAVAARRYGEADVALGRAETRLLNDVALRPAATPDLHQAVADVNAARASAARRQRLPTVETINDALLALEPPPIAAASASPHGTPLSLLPPASPAAASAYAPPVLVMVSPPPPPAMLYRLVPGHWQLHGAQSVWIAPQTVPQPVAPRPLVRPRQVWNGEKWVLVPAHFAGMSPGE